jgi:pimeloyl-ACP methyl ester carboxylesterase
MGAMKEMDRIIIGDIFKHVKLERNMPKLTEREELINDSAPTMVIAGKYDVFFPGEQVIQRAKEIIPNLISGNLYDMGHFPSEERLRQINQDIKHFLEKHYA